jgi:hypothetical protein
MISKYSKPAKRQARDRYRRFASLSSRTAPPPSRQEVGSYSYRRIAPPLSRMQEVGSSSRRTAPPPSRQEKASFDDSVEMWVVALPSPLRLVAPPPPLDTPSGSSSSSSSDTRGGGFIR